MKYKLKFNYLEKGGEMSIQLTVSVNNLDEGFKLANSLKERFNWQYMVFIGIEYNSIAL